MTNEKAIKILKSKMDGSVDTSYEWAETVRMAIKALEEPERTGRCIWCDGIEDRRLRIEFYWIDDDGNTASFSEPHMVATGIAKYCPECGRRLKMGR